MPPSSSRRATDVILPDAPLPLAREACWLAENKAAMESWNAHVAQHGLALAAYRGF